MVKKSAENKERTANNNWKKIAIIALVLLLCIVAFIAPSNGASGWSSQVNGPDWYPSGSTVTRHLMSKIYWEQTDSETTSTIKATGYGGVYKDNYGGSITGTTSMEGTTSSSGSHKYTFNSKLGSSGNKKQFYSMGSCSRTITRTTSVQYVTAKCKIKNDYGSATSTYTFTIPALNKYYLDVNWSLDGVNENSSQEYGTCDVYINGTQVADDVADFYTKYFYGSTYKITDIKAKDGYIYTGAASYSGTITAAKDVRLPFEKIKGSKVTFDANGGTMSYTGMSGSSTTVQIIQGESDYSYHAGLSSTYVKRDGYTFDGFYTEDGVQIYNANGRNVNDGTYWSDGTWQYGAGENITFYARWKHPGKITITKKWDDDLTGEDAANRAAPKITIEGSGPYTSSGLGVPTDEINYDAAPDDDCENEFRIVKDGVGVDGVDIIVHYSNGTTQNFATTNNGWTNLIDEYPDCFILYIEIPSLNQAIGNQLLWGDTANTNYLVKTFTYNGETYSLQSCWDFD